MEVRDRMFGEDKEFLAWIRQRGRTGDLPAFSAECGWVASDTDVIYHRYKQIVDGRGSRAVQGMMLLETKSRHGEPNASQHDTLAKFNAFRGYKRNVFGCDLLRFFGVSVLSMEGTTPENSSLMRWGRFAGEQLIWRGVTCEELLKLLRFDIHPDNFANATPFRRHHQTKELVRTVMTPLGFSVEEKIVLRS